MKDRVNCVNDEYINLTDGGDRIEAVIKIHLDLIMHIGDHSAYNQNFRGRKRYNFSNRGSYGYNTHGNERYGRNNGNYRRNDYRN